MLVESDFGVIPDVAFILLNFCSIYRKREYSIVNINRDPGQILTVAKLSKLRWCSVKHSCG